jgi:hypothetical protein
MEVAGGHEHGGVEPTAELVYRGEIDVRNGQVARGEVGVEDIRAANVDLDAVRARIQARGLDGRGLTVECDYGAEAELGGGDREHARATADVEQAPAVELDQKTEAEAGRRVRAGAKCPPRIDDNRDAIVRRFLPRRADPERPNPDRAVKLAPSLFPAGLDKLRGSLPERLAKPFLAGGVRVDDKDTLRLFEALRMELEELRSGDLDRVRRDRDGDAAKLRPAQRNALLSLSKKPSSAR